jgi:hypothetical protein
MTFVLEELISGDQKNRVDYNEQIKNLLDDVLISQQNSRLLQDNTNATNDNPGAPSDVPDLKIDNLDLN